MSQTWKKLLPFLVGKALSLAGLIAPRKTVELSMRVFAKPRKGRVVSHQRKFLQKAGAEQLEVNGKNYHVHVFGNAGQAHSIGPRLGIQLLAMAQTHEIPGQ
ncbi:MAG: hypothetical protein IPO65_18335 [Saprospiraceae bacterium]|nr:hypothetical protein [Saprospiraceae bacterium]